MHIRNWRKSIKIKSRYTCFKWFGIVFHFTFQQLDSISLQYISIKAEWKVTLIRNYKWFGRCHSCDRIKNRFGAIVVFVCPSCAHKSYHVYRLLHMFVCLHRKRLRGTIAFLASVFFLEIPFIFGCFVCFLFGHIASMALVSFYSLTYFFCCVCMLFALFSFLVINLDIFIAIVRQQTKTYGSGYWISSTMHEYFWIRNFRVKWIQAHSLEH